MLSAGQIFDGYRLIRFIGQGGFGQVWLCISEALGDFHAFKFISNATPELLEREHASLQKYRSASAKIRSPHLMPVEHVNRTGDGLFYIMPLADGAGESIFPGDETWRPLTLSAAIETRCAAGKWFSGDEVVALISPILQALQLLADNGLVHRDVKPENILFLAGKPCLGDISLLSEDSAVLTRRGTPGYAAPSWYAGGSPDMYGASATLFALLTGNNPDKMCRSAFRFPPGGEAGLSELDCRRWPQFHRIVRRGIEEKTSERFPDFTALENALANICRALPPVPEQESFPAKIPAKQSAPAKKQFPIRLLATSFLTAITICAGVVFLGESDFSKSLFSEKQKDEMPRAITPVNSTSEYKRLLDAAGENLEKIQIAAQTRKAAIARAEANWADFIKKNPPASPAPDNTSEAFTANLIKSLERRIEISDTIEKESPKDFFALKTEVPARHEAIFSKAKSLPVTPEEKEIFEKYYAHKFQEIELKLKDFPVPENQFEMSKKYAEETLRRCKIRLAEGAPEK